MARTPLLRTIRQLFRDFEVSRRTGIPPDELAGLRERDREQRQAPSRREFLIGAGALAGALALAPRNARAASQSARVAIIGGGIAGLSAGLSLMDAGYEFTIYEASEVRAGGRMLSSRGTAATCGECHYPKPGGNPEAFAEDQVVDVFGELIDSNHTTMLALCKRFGLPLTDLLAAHPAGSTDTYHFFNQYYSVQDAYQDYLKLIPLMRDDLHSAGYPTTYDVSTPGGRALDLMSVRDYLNTRVPDGVQSRFGQLLDVAYNIEFGAETPDQSSLNFLYLLGYGPRNEFSVYGESDERYHIRGGCDQLPTGIANYLGLGSRVQLGWKLEAIARDSDGSYLLTFEKKKDPVRADIVLLAIPFSILRNIDYSRAGFDALKDRAIREQGQGHNSKLQLQFKTRLWNEPGPWGKSNGNVYSDRGFQVVWDATRGEAGVHGILANYTGGDVTDSLALRHGFGTEDNPAVVADAEWFLDGMEPVFPGLSSQWNGLAVEGIPHLSPLFQCSYSYWKVGQYQTITGYERVRQGNVFFAGEHTSVDFNGWMEGGAAEGVAAGNEIAKVLRGK